MYANAVLTPYFYIPLHLELQTPRIAYPHNKKAI